MVNLSVHDIQTNIFSILEKMEKEGKSFLIFRDGKPVADLIPHKKRKEDGIVNPLDRSGFTGKASRRIRKATMPKVKVKGKPLSEIIIEDRG